MLAAPRRDCERSLAGSSTWRILEQARSTTRLVVRAAGGHYPGSLTVWQGKRVEPENADASPISLGRESVGV